MLLILLPTLYRRLHNKEKLFMAIGGVWTLAVAVSRLRMGMHFLSDVSVSSLLTIALALSPSGCSTSISPSSTKSGPSPPAIPNRQRSREPRKNRNTFR